MLVSDLDQPMQADSDLQLNTYLGVVERTNEQLLNLVEAIGVQQPAHDAGSRLGHLATACSSTRPARSARMRWAALCPGMPLTPPPEPPALRVARQGMRAMRTRSPSSTGSTVGCVSQTHCAECFAAVPSLGALKGDFERRGPPIRASGFKGD